MLLLDQGAPLHMVASGLLKLHRSSSITSLHNSRKQQQVQGRNFGNTSSCAHARAHSGEDLGDGTQELTIAVTNKLSHELGIRATSFTPIGAMAKGGAIGVAS